eukprot:1988804-Rhodomonas_salina.1
MSIPTSNASNRSLACSPQNPPQDRTPCSGHLAGPFTQAPLHGNYRAPRSTIQFGSALRVAPTEDAIYFPITPRCSEHIAEQNTGVRKAEESVTSANGLRCPSTSRLVSARYPLCYMSVPRS